MKTSLSLLLLINLLFPISTIDSFTNDIDVKILKHPNQVNEKLTYFHLNNFELENKPIVFEVRNTSKTMIGIYTKVNVAKTNRFGKIVYDNDKAVTPNNSLNYDVEKNMEITEPYREIAPNSSVFIEVSVSSDVKKLKGIAMGSFSIYQVDSAKTNYKLDKTRMVSLPFVLTTRNDEKLESSATLSIENIHHDVAYGNMVLKYELNNTEPKVHENIEYRIVWRNLQTDESKVFKRKKQEVAPNGGIHQYVNLGPEKLSSGSYGVTVYVDLEDTSIEHYEEISLSQDESLRLNRKVESIPRINKNLIYLAALTFVFSLIQYVRIAKKYKKTS